jgi:hypothetical protein
MSQAAGKITAALLEYCAHRRHDFDGTLGMLLTFDLAGLRSQIRS